MRTKRHASGHVSGCENEGTAPRHECDLLIVSDLHLSEGCPADTKKYSPNEDFLFDAEFARLLAYYSSAERWPNRRWNLVINGDFFDLLQVTSSADAPANLIPKERPEYGLPCGEQESVYKLRKVVAGHLPFFEAVADFAASGNIVSIIKGNHDVELHFPAVRGALIDELCTIHRKTRTAEKATEIDPGTEKIVSGNVRFHDWFLYEPGLCYVEHGNQYDELNSFKYFLTPLLPQQAGLDPKRAEDIDLPWGSLLVRYLFNRVEVTAPFADNIKPCTRFVWWFLRHHPIRALEFLFGDAFYMIRKMQRAWRHVPARSYATRKAVHEARLRALAHENGLPEETLGYVDSLRASTILKEFQGSCRKLLRLFLLWLLYPSLMLALFSSVVAGLLLLRSLAWVLLPAHLVLFIRHYVPFTQLFVTCLLQMTWLVAAGVGGLLLGAVVAGVCRLASRKHPKDRLLDAARGICQKLGVRYVFMGHTHEARWESIGPNGEEYLNTGTWTRIFAEEASFIPDRSEFVFGEVVRNETGVRVRLLRWNDDAGRPDPVRLLAR